MSAQTTPQVLAGEVSGLFALPDLVVRALAVMDSPTGTARDLTEVIGLDASLATAVLRLANSALYGYRGKVETLGNAITMIGHQAVRDLVIATAAVKTFRDIPAEFVDMDTFWDNSITCGVLAKQLAQRAGIRESEALFICGLLHGVGRLVFYARRPVEYRQVLQLAQGNAADLVATERQVFGFDYAELGAALLAEWGLPEKLQAVVGHHLDPTQAPGFAREVTVAHLANQLTDSLAPCLKTRQPPTAYTPDETTSASMDALGLVPDDLDEIRLEALAASLEVIEIMHPGASQIY